MTQVADWLRQPAYIGRIRWGGEEWAGAHTPIVDVETWERVQARLAMYRSGSYRIRGHLRRGHEVDAHERGREPTSLLPLYRCGLCGGPLRRVAQNATWSYYCQAPQLGRAQHVPCCVQALPADAAVMRQAELCLREGVLRRAIREASRASSAASTRAPLEARLAEVDAALSRAVALAHSGMPAEVIMAGNAPLLEEREAIRAQLAALEALEPGAALRELAGITPAQSVRRLQGAPVATQVVLLGLLFDRVEVLPGRRLVFCYVGGLLEPEERSLPRYWSVKRGLTDLGW